TSTITETLINTTNAPVVVDYTITPSVTGCASANFTYKVTVNPSSRVTSAATATICNNTAQNYNIASNVTGTSFTWSRAAITGISNSAVTGQTSNNITEILINTTNAPIAVTYLITPTANACDGATFTYTVTVQPTPVITSSTTGTICSGSAQNYSISSNVTGITFTWDRPSVPGITNAAVSNQGSSIINESLSNSTNVAIAVTYAITPHYNGCNGPVFNYTVTVNPSPVVTSLDSATICNNTAQSYLINSNVTGATYNWSRAAVPGISNAGITGLNSNTITETLVNTVNYPVMVNYVITPTANGCTGMSNKYAVTVYPTSVVTSAASATVCNNIAQNYTLQSNVAGTTYTWSRASVTGISNTAVSNQTGTSITETLTNTTAAPVIVTYMVTPSAHGCSNPVAFTYTVTVNPTPIVSSQANAIVCNSTAQNYSITSNVLGTTYTWSRATVTGISNAPVVNQTGNAITEVLNNTSNAPVDVTYIIIPTANGCPGPSFNYVVTVNPTPIVTSTAAASICNNTAQNYTITSNVSGTTFSWSRATVAGISNTAVSNQTSSTINETLVNNTNAPIVVSYVITPSAYGCTGPVLNYKVTVNPTPVVTSATYGEVCSGSAQNYSISSNVPGATFTWNRTSVAGISNQAMSSAASYINESLNNTTTSSIAVTYAITPHYNGCDGPVFNYTVTVNPSPVVTSSDSASICNNTAVNYSITSNMAGASYTWSRATVPGISNAGVSNQTGSSINETLVNTVNYPVTVTYVITPSSNGCTGLSFKYKVTVYPTSMVTSSAFATVCNNTAQNYTIQSNAAGTTYTWSRASVPGISNAAVSNQAGTAITETLTNTTAGPVTVTYLISPYINGCPGVSPFVYTVVVNPTTTITSSANASICNNTRQQYILQGSVTGITFNWSRPVVTGISNGPVANQTSNIINESLNNTSTAPVTVDYQITPYYNGCASPSFTYSVTVFPTARINNPPATARICNNTAQNTTIQSDVQGATFIWSRAAVAGISNVSVSNQVGTTITEALNNTTNAPIAVTYLITPTANNCEGATWTYTLTVDPTPATPVVTSNSPVCIGSTLNLSASNVMNATYSWTGPNGFTSNLQYPSISNVTMAAEGEYQVIAIVNGCTSEPGKGSVKISNLSSVTNAGTNQVVCGNNAQVTLNGTITGGSVTGIWSTTGTGTFSNDTTLATTYSPSAADIAAGSVKLSLTSTNNGVCTPSVSNVTVSISSIPKANAGPDADICTGNSVVLSGTVSTATGGKWTTSGTGSFSPSSSSLYPKYIPSTEDKNLGRVSLVLTTTGNGNCLAVMDTMNIRIVPLPVVKAGAERDVMQGTRVMLMPSVSGTNLRFLWTPNTNMDNNTSKNPVVTALTDEVYTLTVTGDAGCQAQDKVAIKVLKTFDVPNTFTPNGDGINDTWLIPNLAKYPNCKVLVFNRYGQAVFESIGYTKPWDAISNGKQVPFGTYYYIIDTGIGTPTLKGYITVIR
ncbi:MAG: PKD-like domain-containing protein, partial [Candidatus Dadabacteria bacterium]